MFSKTDSRGKMLVRWKERPMPSRQRSWGGIPVTSRPLKRTCPESGCRWPVIRLKSVVFPAPLGPMMALMPPSGTLTLTPATAWKPSKLLRRSRTSSTARPPAEPAPGGRRGTGDAAGEDEEEDDQDHPQDQRPVLGVGDDLLVEPEQRQGAHRRPEEGAHAAQERHHQDLGRISPLGAVRGL